MATEELPGDFHPQAWIIVIEALASRLVDYDSQEVDYRPLCSKSYRPRVRQIDISYRDRGI